MAEEEEKTQSSNVEFKFQFYPMPDTKIPPFTEHFRFPEGLARCEPGGFVLTEEFGRHAHELVNFKPRKDDVWVVTFPKCGTTWTQEMVWMLLNDCNAELAKTTPLTIRAPFLESSCVDGAENAPPGLADLMPSLDVIDKMASPRVIKSHLPFYLLPPNLLDTCKVVYVARNPKDVMVSYYHHHKLMKMPSYSGDFETFVNYFMNDHLEFLPYFPHILDAWAKRTHPNLLFLFYEDMKKVNLRGQVEKVAQFLDKSPSEAKMALLLEHLKFDNLSKNDSVNFKTAKDLGYMNDDGTFIRKGKTGDWKNHLSPELNRRVEAWIEANLAKSDLRFVMELEQQD
ncbi:sulfotransferase 1E1 isoform X1 [Daphnia magna]|uniref:sulfotransferase 1E1 isoform X1 n=1 Tax=Daphnia magna TaxID=35525 RepID=UPI001E1BD867|nr:sulfotransferase 1E1 isoform X1 [Daphnia magna]